MKYKKIHINQGGLKGAAVEYVENNDRNIPELTKKFPRNPLHLGLQKLFKDLRPHLLNICGNILSTEKQTELLLSFFNNVSCFVSFSVNKYEFLV